MELERSENILIVSHLKVLRCIYVYFKKKGLEESPWMAVSIFPVRVLLTTCRVTDRL
jgi:broad specificity phosphatase PhoE